MFRMLERRLALRSLRWLRRHPSGGVDLLEIASDCRDVVNFPTAAAQYFPHDGKLSVLARHLRSKTTNVCKSSENYLNGICARVRPARTERTHARTGSPVWAARLFCPESKCGGTGITYPFCMFIPLFPARMRWVERLEVTYVTEFTIPEINL
jgi:hypothetical protein